MKADIFVWFIAIVITSVILTIVYIQHLIGV